MSDQMTFSLLAATAPPKHQLGTGQVRASVQFPSEKFVFAASSSASSETMKARMISSSVCPRSIMACACTLVCASLWPVVSFFVARCNMDRGSENAITAHQRAVNMRPQSFGMSREKRVSWASGKRNRSLDRRRGFPGHIGESNRVQAPALRVLNPPHGA